MTTTTITTMAAGKGSAICSLTRSKAAGSVVELSEKRLIEYVSHMCSAPYSPFPKCCSMAAGRFFPF